MASGREKPKAPAQPKAPVDDVSSTQAAPRAAEKPWLFKPGHSGNPGGRPKGLAAEIRSDWTPKRIKDFWASIADDPKASRKDRMQAVAWLSDHGYGRAPETHLVGAMTEEQRDAAVELSRDQLLALVDGSPVGGPQATLPATVEGQVLAITGSTD